MDFQDFLDLEVAYINENIDEDVAVSIHNVIKNNSVKLSGLIFSKKGMNISPTIYMEYYYEQYVKGESIETIGDNIIVAYKDNIIENDVDVDFYKDYEKVKDMLFVKVVNYEQNQELLCEIPHEKYLDLAVVVYCSVENIHISNATILIRNEHLKMWNVSAGEVIDRAKINSDKKLMCRISPMNEMLRTVNIDSREYDVDDFMNLLPMYVVTNANNCFGAAYLAMPNMLERFASKFDGDYYIIPSSIHELILVPSEGVEKENINELIKEVNATQLSKEEVLSDHVYMYSNREQVLKF